MVDVEGTFGCACINSSTGGSWRLGTGILVACSSIVWCFHGRWAGIWAKHKLYNLISVQIL